MVHLFERLVEIESRTPAGLANMISCMGLLMLVFSDALWRFLIAALDRVLWFMAAIAALVSKHPEPDHVYATTPKSDSAVHLPMVAATVFIVCPITISIITHQI